MTYVGNPHKYSIYFDSMNTWDDWYLVPKEQPLIAPPTRKTKTIDIPGADGVLDLSYSLTGYPLYNNRQGSLEFYYIGEDDLINDVCHAISKIFNKTTKISMQIPNEPDYRYKGYFTLKDVKPDNPWPTVTIDYDLDPYKECTKQASELYSNMPIFHNFKLGSATSWVSTSVIYPFDAPVSLTVYSSYSNDNSIKYTNVFSKKVEEVALSGGYNYNLPGLIINKDITLYFKGTGFVYVNYRGGNL